MKIDERLKKKMEVLRVRMAVLGEGEAETTKGYACDARENWNFFENCLRFNPICEKHAIFTIHITCGQVAKTSCQKTLVQNFENFVLSLFHDWGIHSPVSHEPLYVS